MIKTYFSPAKINLFLKILHKRSDDYHEVVTLMQTIDFGDHLVLSLSDHQDSLVSNFHDIMNNSNSIWKALEIFRSHTNIRDHINFELKKKIPLGSGLGGGSSNAATALYALNDFFQTNIHIEQLKEWSKLLGADTPFFFSSGLALGKGIGNNLHDYQEGLPDLTYVLYFDKEGVSSKKAYQNFQIKNGINNTEAILLGYNDLESATFSFRKDLRKKKTDLQRIWSPYAKFVAMTGSGATIVVAYPTELNNKYNAELQKLIKKTSGIPANSIVKYQQWFP